MDKHDVARTLEEISALLELKGENPFKVRAYENAARAVDGLSQDLGTVIEEGKLTEVQGIGESTAQKITELWKSGHMKFYEELVDSIPPGYLEMVRVPGLGAKRVRILGETLGIKSLAELKSAAEKGEVRKLKGFGEKSEKKILEGIALLEGGAGRRLGSQVRPIAEEILSKLRRLPVVTEGKVGGSLRRWMETSKDIDLLVATDKPAQVAEAFLKMVPDASVIASGETKISVRLPDGLAIDLRLVSPKEFPFALHYFTGNVAHNIRVRARALDRGWSLNEYALSGTKKHPPIKSEADLFRVLGLAYIEPELREDRGEIEAAEEDALPELITLQDLKGILHCHTTYSDGRSTLEEMARAAEAWGASYLGISDHSASALYAHGLSEADLKRQHKEIDTWNAKSKKLRILKGAEVDILPDGTLDYPDKVLARLEFVIASIHTNFTMGEDEMTRRVVRALKNKHVSILAHPTGRLLLQRDGYRIRLPEVYRVASAEGIVIEVNASPHRLDLDWREHRAAKEQKIRFAVNPDAHVDSGYDDLRYGIGAARKGWLTKKDVINTLPVEKALAILTSRK
ncbi:MAG: DNA polymerase/3'-5' exonuclease PolX [Chloroflexi bacterium]|nr:MAG: DNA polymerase/3'-5' exonuclease PolX [Chloroflexota bacterium]